MNSVCNNNMCTEFEINKRDHLTKNVSSHSLEFYLFLNKKKSVKENVTFYQRFILQPEL